MKLKVFIVHFSGYSEDGYCVVAANEDKEAEAIAYERHKLMSVRDYVTFEIEGAIAEGEPRILEEK